MKKINFLLSVFIVAAVYAASYGSATHHFKNPEVPKDDPMFFDEVIEIPQEPAPIITEVPLIRTTEYVNLTFEEMELLELLQ